MKNLIKITFILSFLASASAFGQTVVKTDTLSGTPLVMSMDEKISNLLDKTEESCLRTNSSSSPGNYDSGTRPVVKVPEKPLTNAEICRRNPRIMGYKIQLAVVKSNEEAREVGQYFRRRFPNMKVETDASLRPNYKVLAGSYFTRESASADLKRIREYFGSATAVQYRIFCVEAK